MTSDLDLVEAHHFTTISEPSRAGCAAVASHTTRRASGSSPSVRTWGSQAHQAQARRASASASMAMPSRCGAAADATWTTIDRATASMTSPGPASPIPPVLAEVLDRQLSTAGGVTR